MMDERYREISYDITGAIYEVNRALGPGLLEKCYQEALAVELKSRGHVVEREKKIDVFYKGVKLACDYYADMIVDNKAIVELKAVSELNDAHVAQLLNYLHLTNIEFGMLVNFYRVKADIHRYIVTRDYHKEL